MIDETIKNQIENLARVTGKPEEKVVAEVLETGVRNYQKTQPSSAIVLLEIADYAEKIEAKGPRDLSTNHNKYLYEE